MTAINFDRDLTFAKCVNGNTFGNPVARSLTGQQEATTDAALRTNFGSIHRLYGVNSFSLLSATRAMQGMLFQGPAASRRSVYRVKGHNWCGASGSSVLAEVILGVGPSAPDGSDNIDHCIPLAVGNQYSGDFDLTICLDNFGVINSVDLTDRPVFFGCSVANLGTSSQSNLEWSYNLSVQRLEVKNPAYDAAMR